METGAAKRAPGVVLVMTGAELAKMCTAPWVGTLTCFPGMKSAPQYPMAVDRACWQGEPVVMVVAQTRALAEDAAELVEIEWQELPVVAHKETALDPKTAVLHPDLGDNLAFRKVIDTGDVDAAFAAADIVVDGTFSFGRHTAVSLESRALLADYDKHTRRLTLYTSSQVPHMIQTVFARTLGVPEHNVRVVAPDVGGSFGLKIHTFGDEIAATAAAMALGRPVKFIADRIEVLRVGHSRAREPHYRAHGREQGRRHPGGRHRRVCQGPAPIRSFRARASSRPTRSSTSRPDPTSTSTIARRRLSSISTRCRPRNIARSAIRSATRSAKHWSTGRRKPPGSIRSRSGGAT